LLNAEIEQTIQRIRKNAESILQSVIAEYHKKFQALADPFFRERFKDAQDIARRIMGHLRTSVRVSLAHLPPNSVIFARELSPSDTAEANIACANAFVTEFEGATSHTAILARARGTPYVSSIDISRIDTKLHQLAIVDGRKGEVILSPSEATLANYKQFQKQLSYHLESVDHVANLKAETYDGYEIRLSANIEMADELEMLHKHGGHGVGLFRSEYIFLTKNVFPSEEEQTTIYKNLVDKMQGLPIVIRTFDMGGDKQLPGHIQQHEGNPFLGCRAIRFLLKEKDLFKEQLRAILRASAEGDVSILFPMVTTLSELLEAKDLVRQCQAELRQWGEAFGKVRIGCMIEVPSAAIIADLLAKECDFLSIGTNDLVQYALAVDRCSPSMSGMYNPTHPSMLRLVKLIVHEANHQGIPVAMCGELAADPRFTPLLLGLGVHELSVATRYLPTVKHAIRHTSIVTATRLAEQALKLSSSEEIQNLLTHEYQLAVPDDCFYNC
jgi:phosphotransferase system enzyme I (PtsI)